LIHPEHVEGFALAPSKDLAVSPLHYCRIRPVPSRDGRAPDPFGSGASLFAPRTSRWMAVSHYFF